MNTTFDLVEQNYPQNHSNNGFAHFNSPFQMINNNNRSPFYNQNNPPTTNRLRKSACNNSNIFQQALHPNGYSQNFLHHSGGNFSQLYNEQRQNRDKFEEIPLYQSNISKFDNSNFEDEDMFNKYPTEYQNNNPNNYGNMQSAFLKNNFELNMEMQQQQEKQNRNNVQNPYYSHSNFYNLNSLTNNNNLSATNNFNNNNNNNIEQSQRVIRGRGRPKKNPLAPSISKPSKKLGPPSRKRKQTVSSDSEVDLEIQDNYKLEVEQSNSKKNSSKIKNSIDSMKAEDESLELLDQNQSHLSSQNKYQIKTRRSNKNIKPYSIQNKDENQFLEEIIDKNEKDIDQQLFNKKQQSNIQSASKNPNNNHGSSQSQHNSQRSREGSQVDKSHVGDFQQQIGNFLAENIKQYGTPGSIQQIKEKSIELQRKKQLFTNLSEDNINFFPIHLSQQYQQPKQQQKTGKKTLKNNKKSQNSQKQQPQTSTENLSSDEESSSNNQDKKTNKQRIKSQDTKNNFNSNKDSLNNQQQIINSNKSSKNESVQQPGQERDVEEEEEKQNQSKASNSSYAQIQEEKESSISKEPKKKPYDNEADEIGIQSTTLNSIILESSLKNLNKKYLQSTKKSKKMMNSKGIQKKQKNNNSSQKQQPNTYNQQMQNNNEKNNFFNELLFQIQSQQNMINNQIFNPSVSIINSINQYHSFEELSEIQREMIITQRLSQLEKFSIIYQNIGKSLQYYHSKLKQKFQNMFFMKQYNPQKNQFDEMNFFQNMYGLNFNRNTESKQISNSLHNILPPYLRNGSFNRKD